MDSPVNDGHYNYDRSVYEAAGSDEAIMTEMEAEIVRDEARYDRADLQTTWFPESRNCPNCQGFKYASHFPTGQCPNCLPTEAVKPSSPSKGYVIEDPQAR